MRGFKKGGNCINQDRNYQLLKRNSASWAYLNELISKETERFFLVKLFPTLAVKKCFFPQTKYARKSVERKKHKDRAYSRTTTFPLLLKIWIKRTKFLVQITLRKHR